MRRFVSKLKVGVLWLGCLGVMACTGDEARAPEPKAAAPQASQIAETVLNKWTRSCALCHVNGEGGAPRMGVVEEWQPRLEQGKDVLLTHTIEGFNNMPPLGYCMACERDDLMAMIDFMAGGVK